MRDRVILWLLVLMALALIAQLLLIPLLRSWRAVGPLLRVDDLRNEEFVHPYNFSDDPTITATKRSRNVRSIESTWLEYSVDRPVETRVYGPLKTDSFLSESADRRIPTESQMVTVTIEAPAAEPVTLPGGQVMTVRAIRTLPTKGAMPATDEPGWEGTYLRPDGRPMTRDEALQVDRDFRLDVWSHDFQAIEDKLPWHLDILIEVEGQPLQIHSTLLADSLTGAASSLAARDRITVIAPDREPRTVIHRTQGSDNPFDILTSDLLRTTPRDGKSRFVTHQFFNGIRPSPLALHARIWAEEPTIVECDPVAPQAFESAHGSFGLYSVQSFDPQSRRLTTHSGERHQVALTGDVEFTSFSFTQLPEHLVSITISTKDGRILHPDLRLGASGNTSIRFNHTIDQIDKLRFELGDDLAHVVLLLPDLPIIPPENRGLQDVRQMTMPQAALTTQREYQALLKSILQLDLPIYPGIPIPRRVLPADWSGQTVGDFLRSEYAPFPNHEFVLMITHIGVSNGGLQRIGYRRSIHAPRLARFYDMISRPQFAITFIIYLIMLRIGWVTLRLSQLRRLLQQRGYTHLRFDDAYQLLSHLGRRAWKLPSHDELASIPNVDTTSMTSIIAFIHSTDSRRKE